METEDEMQKRHRSEQKTLQAKITQKKKSATKKTRKGIVTECEGLELQLRERQKQELMKICDEFTQNENNAPDHSFIDQSMINSPGEGLFEEKSIDANNTNQVPHPNNSIPEDLPFKKRNRQKERLARRAAEKEAAIEEAKQEASSQPDSKLEEKKKIEEQYIVEGLIEKPIRPDGHCLFSAVADQLIEAGIPLSIKKNSFSEEQRYKFVRESAASYIDEHPDDFAAWLDEPLAQYVEKIRNTAEWGGHLELLALARSYKVNICIIQNGAPQTIEPLPNEAKGAPKIWLAYYRHGFGLGEHYNSLRYAPGADSSSLNSKIQI
ncbi:OTU domain-containing protein 2 [Erysiphe neolycopersici]|uniref:OTU domain-containing protein 2 n=1 Tax=Erysiphe neolycopersici TaxID=212602 RepID=A0A420HUF9_9PEZI|nr:OTU domain-containing protein 2 [Erysiphe neolycopersici]